MFPAGIVWFVLWLVFSVLFRFVVPALTGGRRGYKRTAQRWNLIFNQLQSVHGGTIQRSGRRTLLYIWQGGQISARIDGSYSRLKIHTDGVPARQFKLTRIPRLPFAFFRSFIDEDHQIGDLPYVASRGTEDLSGLKSSPDFWRLLSRLNDARLSVNSDSQGITLSRRVHYSQIEDLDIASMIELADSLAQFRNPLPAEIPVHPIDSLQRCAYCKESLDAKSPLIRCAACGTPQHRECFELNGHCAVYGCTSRIPAKEPVLISR